MTACHLHLNQHPLASGGRTACHGVKMGMQATLGRVGEGQWGNVEVENCHCCCHDDSQRCKAQRVKRMEGVEDEDDYDDHLPVEMVMLKQSDLGSMAGKRVDEVGRCEGEGEEETFGIVVSEQLVMIGLVVVEGEQDVGKAEQDDQNEQDSWDHVDLELDDPWNLRKMRGCRDWQLHDHD